MPVGRTRAAPTCSAPTRPALPPMRESTAFRQSAVRVHCAREPVAHVSKWFGGWKPTTPAESQSPKNVSVGAPAKPVQRRPLARTGGLRGAHASRDSLRSPIQDRAKRQGPRRRSRSQNPILTRHSNQRGGDEQSAPTSGRTSSWAAPRICSGRPACGARTETYPTTVSVAERRSMTLTHADQ